MVSFLFLSQILAWMNVLTTVIRNGNRMEFSHIFITLGAKTEMSCKQTLKISRCYQLHKIFVSVLILKINCWSLLTLILPFTEVIAKVGFFYKSGQQFLTPKLISTDVNIWQKLRNLKIKGMNFLYFLHFNFCILIFRLGGPARKFLGTDGYRILVR